MDILKACKMAGILAPQRGTKPSGIGARHTAPAKINQQLRGANPPRVPPTIQSATACRWPKQLHASL
jgi:hypothetical protein